MSDKLVFFDTQLGEKEGEILFGFYVFDARMNYLSSGETTDPKAAVNILSQGLPITFDLSYNYIDILDLYSSGGEKLDKTLAYISLLDFYRYKRHIHFYVDIGECLRRLGREEGEDFPGAEYLSAKELANLNRILYEELSAHYAFSRPGLFSLPSAITSIEKVEYIARGLSLRDDLVAGKLEELAKKKKYVFFDIECSNTDFAEGKICEFSYVIFDAAGNKLESNEILINPGEGEENDFKLLGRSDSSDLHLKYEDNDYLAYRSSPEFGEVANKIKDILFDEDAAIFGYEVESDLRFLAYSFSRYKVEIGHLVAIDVKRIYQQILHKPVRSLGDLIGRFVPREVASGLRFHAAIDDATATGLVLRYFLLLKGMDLKSLLSQVDEGVLAEISTSFYPDPDLADPETFNKLKADKLI